MPLTEILLSQLTDPFRIGLIVALVFTMLRTRGVTGTVLPLVLGLVFVAVMIPMTIRTETPEPLWRVAGIGLVANAVILAVVLAVRAAVLRFRA